MAHTEGGEYFVFRDKDKSTEEDDEKPMRPRDLMFYFFFIIHFISVAVLKFP